MHKQIINVNQRYLKKNKITNFGPARYIQVMKWLVLLGFFVMMFLFVVVLVVQYETLGLQRELSLNMKDTRSQIETLVAEHTRPMAKPFF
jgi:uncharacterized membrane protein